MTIPDKPSKGLPAQTYRDKVALKLLHGLLSADALPAPDVLVDHAYELADAVIARMKSNVRP